MKSKLLLAILVILAIALPASGKEQKNKLVLLNPQTCTKIDSTLLGLLPDRWRQYSPFVKMCPLRGDDGEPIVAIVSIWVFDFYSSKYPAGAPPKWEDFPLPLIIDSGRRIVGELPEHYPDDPPRELEIHYCKNGSAAPPSIKIKVYNPAVGGDYAYSPIEWNDHLGRYELKDKAISYER